MKKLLSEAAIRAKRIFLAIASFFSTLWAKVLSTFRNSKNAEAKTTYSLNNKSSAGGAGKHVSAAGGKVLSFFKRLPALAVKYSRSVAGIRDVRVSTSVIADGVQVRIRAAVINEAVIPEVTSKVQQTVRDSIENMVGLHVTEVKVIVDNSITAAA